MTNKTNIAIAVVAMIVVVAIIGGIAINNSDDSSGNITVTDGSGRTISLDKPAERVVVYSKYVGEALILMGATDKAIAVTNTIKNDTNYSKYYANTNAVSDKPSEGLDYVTTLMPDLVITHSTNDNSQLEAHGFKYLECGASKINDVHNDLVILGKVLGMEKEAKKILDWFDKYYDLATSVKPNDDVRFALESYSSTKLTFMNPGSTPGQVLDYIGGNNVFSSTSSNYTYPEGSTLIPLNPTVIICVTYNASWNNASLESYLGNIYSRAGWDQIDAVKNGNVYMVSNDIMGGIRSVVGVMLFSSFMNGTFETFDLPGMIDEYNAIAGTDFNNQLIYPAL